MSLRIFSICPEHQSHVRLWLKTALGAMPTMWVMGLIGSLLQQLVFLRLLTVERSKLFSFCHLNDFSILLVPYKFYVLGQIGLSKQCRPRSDCF